MVLNRQEKTPLPGSPDKAQAAYIHTWRRCIVTTRLRTASPLPRSEHSFGKVGDHWEPKDQPGPSDPQDAKRGEDALRSTTPTAGGVNANATKVHLLDIAKRLEISGRTRMTKAELVAAIDRANRAATSKSARK